MWRSLYSKVDISVSVKSTLRVLEAHNPVVTKSRHCYKTCNKNRSGIGSIVSFHVCKRAAGEPGRAGRRAATCPQLGSRGRFSWLATLVRHGRSHAADARRHNPARAYTHEHQKHLLHTNFFTGVLLTVFDCFVRRFECTLSDLGT